MLSMLELNTENGKKTIDKTIMAAIIIFAAVTVVSIVAFFLLPETIYTQIPSAHEAPQKTSKLLYFGVVILVTGLSAAMCVYQKRRKWIAIESVLAGLNLVCIVLNMIFV